jgi:excinuclease ABC subunit A
VDDIMDFINQYEDGTKMAILASVITPTNRTCAEHLSILQQQGFSRVESEGNFLRIEELLNDEKLLTQCNEINLVIDRLSVKKDDEDNDSRMADSIQTAFYEGDGECLIKVFKEEARTFSFSNRFEADGIIFEEPTEHTFSFNNPIGACPTCEGFGNVIGIDEDLVIPNKNLSIYDEAVACWRGEKMGEWKNQLIQHAHKFDFPVHKPYYELTQEQRRLLWTGNQYFYGLNKFFKHLEAKQYKIQNRVMLSRYRGKTTCPDCQGTRLKKEAMYIKVNGKSIHELVLLPVSDLSVFFDGVQLTDHELKVSKRLMIEITSRLRFLNNVGLGYLTLNRLSATLSGGESQRINLATSLGSSLVGSLYILDEPSIGLHPRDTHLLINVLQHLKKLGNTVVVVEHDEEIIRAADEIIDIGPRAGQHGGEVVFQGAFRKLEATPDSLTTQYLNGTRKIETPTSRRSWNNAIEIVGARENNLQNLNVKIPLNILHVITGVSGSGKSSLMKKVLYPALKKIKGGYADKTGDFDLLKGEIKAITDVEFIDQNPIGKSSRSNPATYLKAYDEIRKLGMSGWGNPQAPSVEAKASALNWPPSWLLKKPPLPFSFLMSPLPDYIFMISRNY